MESAAFRQLQDLVEVARQQSLPPADWKLFVEELLGYLALEGQRFSIHAQQFEDGETCQGFQEVCQVLAEFEELTRELLLYQDFGEEDWVGFLQDARALDRLLLKTCEFLWN